jgi:hypothetical protein
MDTGTSGVTSSLLSVAHLRSPLHRKGQASESPCWIQLASKTVINPASLNCTGHAGDKDIKYDAVKTLLKDDPPGF